MTAIKQEQLALSRLYHWEKSSPDRIALIQPMGGGIVRNFTWTEVGDQVRRMASHLQAQGWEPGSRVAILSKNCAWWIMSDLAIWMAGHVSVPLYPTLAAGTIAQILEHSEAKAAFIGKLDGWDAMKGGVPANLPCISFPVSAPDAIDRYPAWEMIAANCEPMRDEVRREADELATLIYTSGTTGKPKGVMHTFAGFAWALQAGLKRIPMTSEDRMLSYLPMAHVVERVLVEHGWLSTGLQVYFAETLETFAADLRRARPTIFFSVPRLWVKFQQGVHQKMSEELLNRLLRIPLLSTLVRRKILKTLGLNHCRLAAAGAAPMPVSLLAWYRRIGLPINEGYGLTENLAVSHLTIPGIDQQGTVGPPFEGVDARINAASGEIEMRSPALMLGYYKDPELSRSALTADGWLSTGDCGQIDKQSVLRITGRIKDLFKTSKGKYVAPAPIEDRLMMHDAVEACVVAGANLAQPLGIVMLNAESTAQLTNPLKKADLLRSFEQHLRDVNGPLDPHEQLDCLVVVNKPWTVENDIITPTFKVKRNRIEEVYGPMYEGWLAQRQNVVWHLD